MATIRKIRGKWQSIIRKKNYPHLAKTVPTPNPLAKTQDLFFVSQVTEAAPPPTVLATATNYIDVIIKISTL